VSDHIRECAWAEYEARRAKGYTEEQLKCFMSGMAVMWRLFDVGSGPLFTYGPDSRPNELRIRCEGCSRGDFCPDPECLG